MLFHQVCQLGTPFNVHFFEDIPQMALNGKRADAQPGADLLVGQSHPCIPRDDLLSFTQAVTS